MTQNPYAAALRGDDALVSLAETPATVGRLVDGWSPADFERSYAPGKWSARQLLVHLVQSEIVFGDRARFALTTPGYTVVPFEQDDWLPLDDTVDAAGALAAYLGLRRVNLAFFRSLSTEQLAHPFAHPTNGTLDVRWMLILLAGHERHHLPQFEAIAASRR